MTTNPRQGRIVSSDAPKRADDSAMVCDGVSMLLRFSEAPKAAIHKLGVFSLALGNLGQTSLLFTKFLMDECGDLPGDLGFVAHDLSAGEAQEREAKPLQDALASAIFTGLLRGLLVKRIAIGLEHNQRVLHADVGGKDREVHVPNAGDAQLRHQDEQAAPLLQQLRLGSELRGRIKPAAPVGIEVRQFVEKRLAKNKLDGAFVINQRPQFAGYRIGGVLGRNTSHKHSPNWGPTNRVRSSRQYQTARTLHGWPHLTAVPQTGGRKIPKV